MSSFASPRRPLYKGTLLAVAVSYRDQSSEIDATLGTAPATLKTAVADGPPHRDSSDPAQTFQQFASGVLEELGPGKGPVAQLQVLPP